MNQPNIRASKNCFLGIVAILLLPLNVSAAVFNVACNVPALLSALQSAESNAEADNINLASNCSYNFTTFGSSDQGGANALPILNTEVSIFGNGSTLRRDSGAADFRILKVDTAGVVNLYDLKIENGKTANAETLIVAPDGGGVLNMGVLAIRRSEVGYNRTGNGAVNGAFPFSNGGDGGGIYSQGVLVIVDSSIHNNRTGSSNSNGLDSAGIGGGMFLDSASVSIERSAIYGNTVGGRPSDSEDPASVGGGIYSNNAGGLAIRNSSIFGNRAIEGAAVYAASNVYMNHVTIAYNTPNGIYYIGGASATLDIENSIVSNHITYDCLQSSGGINIRNSLIQDVNNEACNTINGLNSSITGGVADLQISGNYGGFSPGMALGISSQAINKGSITPMAVDQRGIRRPQPSSSVQLAADIGALEKQSLTVGPTSDFGVQIFTATMDQWFEVELNAGDTFAFNAFFSHAAGDLDVGMYHKRDLMTPVKTATSSSDNELLEFEAAKSGTFWLRVFGFNGAINTFNYQATIVKDQGFCVPVKTGKKIVLICV